MKDEDVLILARMIRDARLLLGIGDTEAASYALDQAVSVIPDSLWPPEDSTK